MRLCLQIDRAHQANHVPFVVGGTAYWIQHLLFPDRLPVSETPSTAGTMTQALGQALDSLSSEQRHLFEFLENIVPATTAPPLALSLHGLLTAIDPVTAARWHWKDVRKVLRSLKLVTEQGCLPSEVYEAQSLRNIVPRSVIFIRHEGYTLTSAGREDTGRSSCGSMHRPRCCILAWSVE